jgi:hypothetical protein
MGDKIVVGNGGIGRGLKKDKTAFNINNDSFPTLLNAYQWRGRVKRKRGTSLLNRLRRYFNSTSTAYSSTATISLSSGAANILTGFSLQANGNIVPGSVTINNVTVAQSYTDPAKDGTLTGSIGGTGTINYASGDITISGGAGNSINATFNYYPDLPVMGLEDLVLTTNPLTAGSDVVIDGSQFPGNIGFDTTYAYNILPTSPYSIYDVSFYKNPSTSGSYTAKTTWTPTTWNGQDYQQFWTVNYQGALWATNGINIPFRVQNIGMQYKAIITVTVLTATTASLNITAHGLVVGDFVFINEVVTTTGINFQTGYVTTRTDANNVVVTFPNATITTSGTGGIAQYLTNRSDVTKDCLRWYDGDPTNGNATTPTLNSTKGWVNFAPPLSQSDYSIADLPADQYYLVGARMIVPFKDRLLFVGPVIQTSSPDSQVYLQDTVIYSQNGTPYYTCSYTNTPSATVDTPTNATTVFNPILVPANQTATSTAYFEDSSGFGGFITAGTYSPIVTVTANEDVLIMGFSKQQARFVYTGNDIVPFNFFTINSELGSSSTFSAINLDRGAVSSGANGIIITSQVSAARLDLDIPDEIFQFNLTNNGAQRVAAQRDFINEWICFTYPDNEIRYKYPNQTLQYNYRDDSWALFQECYTTYGQFRKVTGNTWVTIGDIYPTWAQWNEPWNAGSSTLLQPQVMAGNQQGFVMLRDDGTAEGNSLYIRSFSGNVVTSPDHCLNRGDYIIISGCIGTIGYEVNNKVFSVLNTPSDSTFTLNPPIGSGTYLGGGVIKRMYVPLIQTKQFPVAWEMARKTRIGPQMYLLSATASSEISLLIYLSQNSVGQGVSAYNEGPIVPEPNTVNNSLIYSTVLYTCPESTNLGLTPANTNLQMVTAADQDQIWHRINTSLIGDTIQFGFTMSDTQMTALTPSGNTFTITGATQASPCVLTCTNQVSVNQLVSITGVVGMTQLNGNVYNVIARSGTTITIGVDSTAFTAYSSGGSLQVVGPQNQFAEIELHGMIIDVTPSMSLA